MTREELRTAIAAAIKEATSIGGAPNKPCVIGHLSAADAALAALEAAGVRLAPSEATHKMADVGTEARWQSAVRDANNVREIWRAMLAASPYALKETGQ
jgi:hypothetical protein